MAAKKIDVADVVRHNGPIMLPESMSTEAAVGVLMKKIQYDSEPVRITEKILAYPWDGAIALAKALAELHGYAMQAVQETQGFFGKMKNPPELRSIATGPDSTVLVPWGQFVLPGTTATVMTGVVEHDGRMVFAVMATCTHGEEHTVRRLILRCREIAASESIYKGKAIEMAFTDSDGEAYDLPEPTFLRLGTEPPIFSRSLEQAIERNILTPIRFRKFGEANGVPFKRGVLLAGDYGTGKTLTAQAVARVATENGVTFVYVRKAADLAEALRFAEHYMPAVVLAEDVERIAGTERTEDVNVLLNTLDGIGSKASDIMTILTSNHAESINPAMRRPGRIDVVLHVTAPDAEAVERLVRHYGGSRIPVTENLHAIGLALAGERPATIREAVERAKLESIRRSNGETCRILARDLAATAEEVLAEQRLFVPKAEKDATVRLGEAIGSRIGSLLVAGANGSNPASKHALNA